MAGGLVLAACGSSSKSSTATGSTAASGHRHRARRRQAWPRDLKVAALATGLENLAVAAYQAGIDAATAGKLGTVPPAVVTFAQTAQMQHKDHADAWNAILTAAGKPTVTGVDTTVKTGGHRSGVRQGDRRAPAWPSWPCSSRTSPRPPT